MSTAVARRTCTRRCAISLCTSLTLAQRRPLLYWPVLPPLLLAQGSTEYQKAQKELRRTSQRLLLLGMSCGSLAEESIKSSPGRFSEAPRRSGSGAASPSGRAMLERASPASGSLRQSKLPSPDAVSGRRHLRV